MAAALDAYGHWVRHAHYGEVWVPDGVPSDWQPYEYGTGSIPTTGAGTGSPTRARTTGAGWSITTAARFMTEGHGAGCRATNRRRLGRLALWRRRHRLGAAAAGRSDRMRPTAAAPSRFRAACATSASRSCASISCPAPSAARFCMRASARQSIDRCPYRRPAAVGQSGPGARFHRRPHACDAARLPGAPARFRRYHRRAGRSDRASAGLAHQGRGQARSADYRAAHQRDDPGDHPDCRAEGARQGRTRTSRQPAAARRSGRRSAATTAAAAATAKGANGHAAAHGRAGDPASWRPRATVTPTAPVQASQRRSMRSAARRIRRRARADLRPSRRLSIRLRHHRRRLCMHRRRRSYTRLRRRPFARRRRQWYTPRHRPPHMHRRHPRRRKRSGHRRSRARSRPSRRNSRQTKRAALKAARCTSGGWRSGLKRPARAQSARSRRISTAGSR